MGSTIIELFATVALSAYFPVITFSFFKFRLARKKEELQLLGERLNEATANPDFDFEKKFQKEFSPGDYILPLVFVTAITLMGIFLLLMGWILYAPDADGIVRSILWSGSAFWENFPDLEDEKRAVAVVAFAVLGSFLSSAQYIYRRYATVDLTPTNFFSVGIRMILSMVISLMISYAMHDKALSASGEMILVVAFLTGIFPEKGFRVLIKRVKILRMTDERAAKNYSLDSIEGMNLMHKMRLNEVGVDNVQNLAQFDFLLLIVKTPFPTRLLLDWVAQSKLIMEFQHEYKALHQSGIRTILDFWDACYGQPDRIKKIAELTGIKELAIEINLENISQDQSVALLRHFRQFSGYMKQE